MHALLATRGFLGSVPFVPSVTRIPIRLLRLRTRALAQRVLQQVQMEDAPDFHNGLGCFLHTMP